MRQKKVKTSEGEVEIMITGSEEQNEKDMPCCLFWVFVIIALLSIGCIFYIDVLRV